MDNVDIRFNMKFRILPWLARVYNIYMYYKYKLKINSLSDETQNLP